MKKIILMVFLVLLVSTVMSVESTWSSIGNTGILPKDANRQRVQVGRFIQLHDYLQTSLEHLDENDFATHANWDVTNDITDATEATWVWADGDASTLTQVNADQALVVRNVQSLLLTYDVGITTPIAGGVVTAVVTGICAATSLDLTAGTGKTVAITTGAAGSAADFVITIDPDASVSAGEFTLDNIYLTGYYESPVSMTTATDITLYTPTNAVELVIDPQGDEVKIEIGSAWYVVNTLHSFPCSGFQTIKVANDSGSTVSLNFYYNKL